MMQVYIDVYISCFFSGARLYLIDESIEEI